ncbi:hypothetical protein ACFWBN_31590 [Streptomyces sp. NPDC059989]|uniref:hypothetical protein n=1 Tax=Streptomyces sp. NPDC059989 TaxID=3347026 RepID=UPI0036766E6D
MTRRPHRPERLSADEATDWQECQNDHENLMAQLADREALIENGLIDSYEEYAFAWDRPSRKAPRQNGPQPADRSPGRRDTSADKAPF